MVETPGRLSSIARARVSPGRASAPGRRARGARRSRACRGPPPPRAGRGSSSAVANASALAWWRCVTTSPKWSSHSSSAFARTPGFSAGARPARSSQSAVSVRPRWYRTARARNARSKLAWKPTSGAGPAQSRNSRQAAFGSMPSRCTSAPMPWTRMLSRELATDCRTTSSKASPTSMHRFRTATAPIAISASFDWSSPLVSTSTTTQRCAAIRRTRASAGSPTPRKVRHQRTAQPG